MFDAKRRTNIHVASRPTSQKKYASPDFEEKLQAAGPNVTSGIKYIY